MKLRSNKTYIIPTRYGFVFLPLLLIEFTVSITFGHPFAYFMTFSTVSIIVLSAFYTNESLNEISIGYLETDLIESQKKSPIKFKLSLKEKFIRKEVSVEIPNNKFINKQTIYSGKEFLEVKVEFPNRGIFSIERLKVSSTFPFGLFYAWKYIDTNRHIYVYPKILQEQSNKLNTAFEESTDRAISTVGSNNDDFLEHRKAQETDSWKHIDWKAYSRGIGFLSKVYSENQSQGLTFKIDSKSSENELQTLVSSLFGTHVRNIPSTLLIDNVLISKGDNQEHIDTCLRSICSLQFYEETHV